MSGSPTITRLAPVVSRTQVNLGRLRWAVRATLTLGVAASVAANILHARPNPISQIIAAWPPLALLLTVELISRLPTHRRGLGITRLLATAAIAGIAAWVSYWHMVGVAARYGETEAAAAYLLPVSVDGLVIVASISLVEITGRIRTATLEPVRIDQPDNRNSPGAPDDHTPPAKEGERHRTEESRKIRHRRQAARRHPSQHKTRLPQAGSEDPPGESLNAAEQSGYGRVPSDTAAAVGYWYRHDPSLHPAEIATRIGRSERTVRRYWPFSPAPMPR